MIFLPIPDPGVKKAPDPGSGSATLILSLGFYTTNFPSMTDEGGKGKGEKKEQKDRVVNPGNKKFPVRRRITVFGSRLRKESKYFEKM